MAEKKEATGSIWNVNSWHWEMKNYTEIAKKILQQKLLDLTYSINNIKITHTNIRFPKAEAEINIRKGKQYLVYEFELDMDVLAENQQQQSKGSYRAKQILHDDLDDMIIDDVKMNEKNGVANQSKKFLKNKSKEFIKKVFKQFEHEITSMEGNPQKLEEDKKKRQQAINATLKARQEKGQEKERLLEEQREKQRRMKQEAFKAHFESKK